MCKCSNAFRVRFFFQSEFVAFAGKSFNRNGTFTLIEYEFQWDFDFTALFATFSVDSGLKIHWQQWEIVTELLNITVDDFDAKKSPRYNVHSMAAKLAHSHLVPAHWRMGINKDRSKNQGKTGDLESASISIISSANLRLKRHKRT